MEDPFEPYIKTRNEIESKEQEKWANDIALEQKKCIEIAKKIAEEIKNSDSTLHQKFISETEKMKKISSNVSTFIIYQNDIPPSDSFILMCKYAEKYNLYKQINEIFDQVSKYYRIRCGKDKANMYDTVHVSDIRDYLVVTFFSDGFEEKTLMDRIKSIINYIYPSVWFKYIFQRS